MFGKYHAIALTLCIASIGLYFKAYYHHHRITGDEQTYASFVAALTSPVLPDRGHDGPSYISEGLFVDEDIAVLYVFLGAALLSVAALLVLMFGWLKWGASRNFVSLGFLAVAIILSVAITAVEIGLIPRIKF